jgi:sugar phosphate isomerase/epimerase
MNTNNISRRSFIKTTGSLGVTASLAGYAFASNKSTTNQWATACRDAHLSEVKAPNVWAAMKQIGVTGIEIQVNEELQCPSLFHSAKKYSIDSPKSISELQSDLEKHGLHASAFMMANKFDARPEMEVKWCSSVVKAAKEMGVKAIRIDVVPRKIKRENFLPFAVKMCKSICKLVENSDVHYAIENHGNTTNDPEFLNALFNKVGSDNLGLTLDTANFYWYGHPLTKLYDIFEMFAPRAFHTHCKSINYPEDKENVQRKMGWEYGKYNCPVYQGDIDFAKVVSILKKANYQGDLCIEDESLGKFPENERVDVLSKEASYLAKFI